MMLVAAAGTGIERFFAVLAGFGIGLLAYGLLWRTPPKGVEPIPFLAGRYRHSPYVIALGSMLIVVGGLGAGLAYLLANA